MGANSFFTIEHGTTAQAAFRTARDNALHEHGHGGYSGSIAEKRDFKMVTKAMARAALQHWKDELVTLTPEGQLQKDHWERIREDEIPYARNRNKESQEALTAFIDEGTVMPATARDFADAVDRGLRGDKWGPAWCVEVDPKMFLFFGTASS